MLIFSGRFAAALARIASANDARVALSPGAISLLSPALQVHVYQGGAALECDARALPDGWLTRAAKLAGGARGQLALDCGPRDRGFVAVATGPKGAAGSKLQTGCSPHDKAPWIKPDAQTERTAIVLAEPFAPGGPVARALACAGDTDKTAGIWLGSTTEATDGRRLAREATPALTDLAGFWLPLDAAKALLALVASESISRLDISWDGERCMVRLLGSETHIWLCALANPSKAWLPDAVRANSGETNAPTLTFRVDVEALASLVAPMKAGKVTVHSDGALVVWTDPGPDEEGPTVRSLTNWRASGAGTDHAGPTIGAPVWSAAVAVLLPALAAAKRAKRRQLDVTLRGAADPGSWGEALVMPVVDTRNKRPLPFAVPAALMLEFGFAQAVAAEAAVGVAA